MDNSNNGLNPQSKFINQVRTNTKSDLIEITEDKLENILLKYIDKVKKTFNWLTPLSLFLTILIVLLTAEFKTFIGIDKTVWNAFFLLSLLLTGFWTIKSGYYAIKCSKESTIEKLLQQIKNATE